jgi:hypothetical protein
MKKNLFSAAIAAILLFSGNVQAQFTNTTGPVFGTSPQTIVQLDNVNKLAFLSFPSGSVSGEPKLKVYSKPFIAGSPGAFGAAGSFRMYPPATTTGTVNNVPNMPLSTSSYYGIDIAGNNGSEEFLFRGYSSDGTNLNPVSQLDKNGYFWAYDIESANTLRVQGKSTFFDNIDGTTLTLSSTISRPLILDRRVPTNNKTEIWFSQMGTQKWALGTGSADNGTNDFYVWGAGIGIPFYINSSGQVGIGTTKLASGAGLSVGKPVVATGFKVADINTTNWIWPDYVFSSDYKLKSLTDVEKFIQENKHLPEVPSAEAIEQNGFDLVQMDAKLLQKIEELTLYMIELKKENEALKKDMELLKQK